MSDLDVGSLRKLIDEAITQWSAGTAPASPSPSNEITEVKDLRVLPEGKRVVRTKSSGDRVYQIDENTRLRQWVTSGDILTGLGWNQEDVVVIEDKELLGYQMGSPIYKVENEPQT